MFHLGIQLSVASVVHAYDGNKYSMELKKQIKYLQFLISFTANARFPRKII